MGKWTGYMKKSWIPAHAAVDRQRYPLPGDSSPEVRVGIVNLSGGRTVWIKVPIAAHQDYIPRFGWLNSHTVWVEVLTHDHKTRNIYFADSSSGMARLALTESAAKFFDEDYDVT